MGKRTKIVLGVILMAAAAGIGLGIYHAGKRDPVAIHVDPRLYDDYVGYYDFGNNYVLTVRRDGDRLISTAPEQFPRELLAEAPARFFVKGEPARISFHRGTNGHVDYMAFRWKKFEDKAYRIPSLPAALECTNAMIAATTGGESADAGLAILKEGGTAVDAAMAISLCQVVHAGGSYVSLAGPLMMVYYEASSGQVHYLDAQYNTPLLEVDGKSIPKKGGRTALVPGFMAGVHAAHERFGKMPFARLFNEAIAMAEGGRAVNPSLEWWIDRKRTVLSRLPETKKVFTRPDGKFYRRGDVFRQPELAATLRGVQREGVGYMYLGPWARRFVEVIQKQGGKITLDDMKRYRAVWEEPLQTTYRNYRVFAPGLSSWGGVNTVEGLNLLELADLKRYGHFTTSPDSVLWMSQISRVHHLTWRAPRPARHDFSPRSRATKETSAWIWKELQNGTWDWLPKGMRKSSSHTDALVVVDQWGNMAVVNHTINTTLWGNTGIFVDGVSIPDSGAFQGENIAAAGPGKRLPIGMSPVIVTRDGKPYLGSSTTGGGLHPKHLQVLVSILDFGMDPQSAVDTPSLMGDGSDMEIGTFDPKVIEAVRKLGCDLHLKPPEKIADKKGYWVGILIDPKTGGMQGGVSRGLEGNVVGY